MNSARSWVVFGAAVLAYVVGMTQRTSFGVAGVEATERFAVSAATVSSVAVIQIIVYAVLQIPVGVLADRVGPKRLIVAGALIMAAGQVVLAFAPSIGVVIAARVLVGMGDALTFVSVIRLLPNWFGGRILPQLAQWVGTLGQFGQIIATVPFAFLLQATGWRPALLAASGLSVVAAAVAAALVRRGEPPPLTSPVPAGGMLHQLLATVRRPGTQLGFWVHLTGGTAPTAMGLLWGYPFLTAGLGLDLGTAAFVFTMLVVGNVTTGPVLGYLVTRYPMRRSNLALFVVSIILVVWAVVVLWPGTPPTILVGALFLAIGMGGPGSLIGFDVARTLNPSHAMGSASGIVNTGGFIGGFLSMFGMGLVIDLVRATGGPAAPLYSLDAFRLAFVVPIAVIVVGMVGVAIARRRARRALFEAEGIQIAPLWVALFRARRGRPPGTVR
ncbi:MAG: MFS transporter [Microbacteriaceae bacterium]|nr:MFS transporter [Microbacteriaceae bacterium]